MGKVYCNSQTPVHPCLFVKVDAEYVSECPTSSSSLCQVVHVSGVEILKAKVPDLRRVDLLPCCGHAVNLDQPKMFADVVVSFWSELHMAKS